MRRDQILETSNPRIKLCLKTDRVTARLLVLWVNKFPFLWVLWISPSIFVTQRVPISAHPFQTPNPGVFWEVDVKAVHKLSSFSPPGPAVGLCFLTDFLCQWNVHGSETCHFQGGPFRSQCLIHHFLSFPPIMMFQMMEAPSAWVPDWGRRGAETPADPQWICTVSKK